MIRSLRLRMMIAVGTLAIAAIVAVALTARQRTRTEFRRFQALTKIATSANGDASKVAAILQKRCCDSASLQAAAAELSPKDVLVITNSADQIIAKYGKPLESIDNLRLSRAGDETTIYLTTSGHGKSAAQATLMIHMDGTRIHSQSDGPAALYVFPVPDREIEQPDSIFLGSVDRSLLLVTGLVAATALLVTWTLTRRVAGPVEDLREAARQLAMGDLTGRVSIRGSDEIAELSKSFNAMASELEKQQELRRNLVHDVVHELRTPLTALRCRLDSISDGVSANPHGEIEGASEEIDHLTRLVEDLHEVALAEARELRLNISEEPLAPIIASAVRAAGLECNSRIQVNCNDCIVVRADAVRLRQVVLNILTNAARHTPSSGRVTVSVTDGIEGVIVEIHNTGSHLTAEEIVRVFDRFYRADPSRERSTGGTGLGLAIVKNIIEAHGGCVWASSDEVGVSFGFSLPSNIRKVSTPMKRMSIAPPVLIALALSPHMRAQELDSLLAKAMKDSRVPAMAVLRIQHGRITGEAARGVRSIDKPDMVTTRDVWHIGSNGKAMTAAMIARLIDRHILSWDMPLDQMLPELAAGMQPAYRSVNLRDLLSHQAGLQANIKVSALDAFRRDPRPMHELRLAYAALALAQNPAYSPRTDNLYSNSGLVIAATIAERVTGLSYERLMQQEVFGPLHMSSAAFGPTHEGQPLGHGNGRPQIGPDADNAPVIAPVGEIHLTMQDWARFAIDQMAGEHGRGKLLHAETYKYLHAPGRPGSEFALGWMLARSLAAVTGPFLTHAGSNTYWYAVIVLKPNTESGLLVAANAGQDAGADKIDGSIVKELLPKI